MEPIWIQTTDGELSQWGGFYQPTCNHADADSGEDADCSEDAGSSEDADDSEELQRSYSKDSILHLNLPHYYDSPFEGPARPPTPPCGANWRGNSQQNGFIPNTQPSVNAREERPIYRPHQSDYWNSEYQKNHVHLDAAARRTYAPREAVTKSIMEGIIARNIVTQSQWNLEEGRRIWADPKYDEGKGRTERPRGILIEREPTPFGSIPWPEDRPRQEIPASFIPQGHGRKNEGPTGTDAYMRPSEMMEVDRRGLGLIDKYRMGATR